MAKPEDLHAEIHVDGHVEAANHEPSLIDPNITLLVLTWVTFFLLLAVLYKLAWKPILTIVDEREKKIENSVKQAEKIQLEMEALESRLAEAMSKAESDARQVIDEAKKAGQEISRTIQTKAQEDAKIILENAQRDIKEAQAQASAQLRRESAEIAVQLAEKLIIAKLDDQKSRELVDSYIKEL